MDDRIQVETAQDDHLRPLAFTWEGRRYQVLEVGRQQPLEGEHRVLAMVEGDQVFELAFHLDEESWHVRRRPDDFGPVKQRI
jgi:hypothetical protein